jgi:uncharacterized membrane protein HdeD (DUF308 family)
MSTAKKQTHAAKPVVQAVLLIILGLLAFFAPIYTAYSITLILGWVCILSSVIYLISCLRERDGHFAAELFLSILGIVLGILLITHGLTILSVLLGVWFLLFGFALLNRGMDSNQSAGARGLMIIAAILAILFALGLFFGWSMIGLSMMGAMLGVVLVLQGISFFFRSC